MDEDHTPTSRALTRSLDAFQSSEVVLEATSMPEALEAMRRGEVYAIFHIPPPAGGCGIGTSAQAPLYTNSAYLMAGSFTSEI